MVTLTYEGLSDWTPRHISDYLRKVRRYLEAHQLPTDYVWVAELQERGAVHYHVLLWVPLSHKLPKPDQSGMWQYGSSRIERARYGGVGYLTKYISKFDTKHNFPVGLHVYGVGGLSLKERLERAWYRLPRYIRDQCDVLDRVRRAQGGGWLFPLTGELVPALFEFVGMLPGGRVLVQPRSTQIFT